MSDDPGQGGVRTELAEARRTPWRHPGGLRALLSDWQGDVRIWRNVTYHEQLAARSAQYAEVPEGIGPKVRAALSARGIGRLYAHQARAYELATAGRDVVIATPTASGKSLCYNLPVLDALGCAPEARALYVFPTKALARDQENALRGLLSDAGLSHGAVTYDGDTPADVRRAARQRTGLVLTNPDMLHAGILPHHADWSRVFSNLRYVIIDELHTYRGVFGSHLANVLRRLCRIAEFHGSRPVFLFASATIGNPAEHAERMIGRPVALLADSGAPTGPRRVIVYNPPVVNAELGMRQSYVKASVRLTTDLVRQGVSTLVFGQSRNNVEVMLKYLRERLARDRIDPTSVQAYRGGYLPDQRRRIEERLRAGDIRCVVATNALELGIDIGSLDAVVCAGYPGTLAGLWQRFGRGGRRGEESLSLLVASSAPLDQYVARDAQALLGAPSEAARIDPDNVEIIVQHIKCASFELPFEDGEGFGDVPADVVADALRFLADSRLVHPVTSGEGRTRYHWSADSYPANHVSLRSVGWDNFVIIDVAGETIIGEMDFRSTHTMLHEQAIYQHGGEQFQVERLDFDNHKAYVRKVTPDYYTSAMTHVAVSVLEQEEGGPLELPGRLLGQAQDERGTRSGGAQVGAGDVSVVEKVVGYKKIRYNTHENVGYGEVRLPEMQMHTTAFWLMVPEDLVGALPVPRPTAIDALRGLGNALHTVASVGLMIDPRDLGHALGDRKQDEDLPSKGHGSGPGFDPTIFLYDRIPGGIGLSPRIYDERVALLFRTRQLIDGCGCDEGCPACVGPVAGEGEASGDLPSRKLIGLWVLDKLGVLTVH
ncbi:MAG: DEAD/DEAH box helicase [Myxococcales bacterium]|nr:DEAD/DEAH box helicase [Myxococcales bacterium]MDD9971878.1 DEAD/DEAH box helicase [Myxococcales bacterium]